MKKTEPHRYDGMHEEKPHRLWCSCGWYSTVVPLTYKAKKQYQEWLIHFQRMNDSRRHPCP